jgi:hypothetical protein
VWRWLGGCSERVTNVPNIEDYIEAMAEADFIIRGTGRSSLCFPSEQGRLSLAHRHEKLSFGRRRFARRHWVAAKDRR